MQSIYLFFIVDGTLRDLDTQRLVERTMCNLSVSEKTYDAGAFEAKFLQIQNPSKFPPRLNWKWLNDVLKWAINLPPFAMSPLLILTFASISINGPPLGGSSQVATQA